MANGLEDVFQSWAQPPSHTEQTKCENAESVIRNSVNLSPSLNTRNITVFTQGSYHNRTNVRTDSDVDICILCRDTIYYDLPNGTTPSDFNLDAPAEYLYPEYKNDVENALVHYLGRGAVTRGNKAFDVHENTYRVDSDVVACFEYRRYLDNGTYIEGTKFLTDGDTGIINWPEQNYSNGVDKNSTTGRRYKAIVRILKCLRNWMSDQGYNEATIAPSYLIECLVWNVPNHGFGHNSYTGDVRFALAHLFNNTLKFDKCKEWGEVNELKYLFRTGQPWTFQQTHNFISKAWDCLGFE